MCRGTETCVSVGGHLLTCHSHVCSMPCTVETRSVFYGTVPLLPSPPLPSPPLLPSPPPFPPFLHFPPIPPPSLLPCFLPVREGGRREGGSKREREAEERKGRGGEGEEERGRGREGERDRREGRKEGRVCV